MKTPMATVILDAGEDLNGNGILDVGDKTVVVYYDNTARLTRACYGTVDNGTCSGTTVPIYKVKYLWNAASWLNNPYINDLTNIKLNRTVSSGTQSFTANDAGVDLNPKRYIFTWNDLDNDGAVDDSTEVLPFTEYLGKRHILPVSGSCLAGPCAPGLRH